MYICRTRWVDRITGLDTFEGLFPALVKTFEEMSINVDKKCNRETSAKASCFLKLITSFDFIAAMVITRCLFDCTLDVTKLLQGKTNDISDGIHLIESLKSLLTAIRNEIDFYHDKWYDLVLKLAEDVDVDEKKPRTCGRQTYSYRANIQSDSVSTYYKQTITVPMVDYLCSELRHRFDNASLNAYYGLSAVPRKVSFYN